nr:unnamed protein product [Digitaria exilis]
MVVGSLILLLLLATAAHGLRRLDMQVAPNKNKVEIPADFKWQWRPSSSGSPVDSASAGGGGMTPEHHASTVRAAPAEDDDGEVRKKTRTSRSHHVVAPTLIHDEDYAGPNGHSPNHHRTIRCGPC